MNTQALWKLPQGALKRVRHGWQVKSERGWGDALAVFAPLRRLASGGWQLALRGDEVLGLTPVDDSTWQLVPLAAGEEVTHYLCMLRYDQPLGRPDRSFRTKLRREDFSPAHASAPATAESGTSVTALQLRHALQQVHSDVGPRLSKYVVTAPAAAAERRTMQWPASLSFAFASCQYPAGMLDRRIAHASYRALAEHLEQPGVRLPERILLLGDQVYADATYGLLDPVRLDDAYRTAYEDFSDRELGPLTDLPQDALDRMRMTPDDHEIIDNWEPGLPGSHEPRVDIALDAFWQHQRMGARRRRRVQLSDHGPGWRVFMADTRTQRDFRSCDTLAHASILGEPQAAQLERWLLRAPHDQLKIVTSGAMLLPRNRQHIDEPIYLDNWQGYPASLHRLLAFLCDHDLRNVVFLSGDAHLGCTADITVTSLKTGRQAQFCSHHAPALYAPYPFANESRWNLLLRDAFCFRAVPDAGGCEYRCEVSAQVLAEGSNGCGWLQATRVGQTWQTAVQVLRG